MAPSLGILFLRLAVSGLLIYSHGWAKLINFTNMMASFPDPLHIGSPLSLTMAVFAELFCSVLVFVGLATRLAAIPIIITMLVAIFLVHGDDPLAKKELAIMYLIPMVTLLLTGPGKFSVDGIVLKKKR